MNGDPGFCVTPFDDIAKYFSKKEWEKMKRKYEAMTKLGFKVTLPPFMHNKRATDFQGNDSDNDCNLERPQMTFSRGQGIFLKIILKKPAEEGNDSKGVPETSGPQNDGKQLCPWGKANTSEKINKRSGPKRGKHAWTHRLRERKQWVIYEEISDPEEDDE
uniref:KRAB-related domain-containing protein n=1 Tax=Colobus angolensis palliatus TaxID=336983 RepID=A0A2K5JMM9_COLAP